MTGLVGADMSGKASKKKPIDGAEDPYSVVGPVSGGSLAEFVEHLKALGRSAALSPDGKQAFVPGTRGELQRFPLECHDKPDSEFVRSVLGLPGTRLVSYLVPGDDQHVANSVDYVCRVPGYCLDVLRPNTRNNIRRGLRAFTVRLCSWDELAEKGMAAYAETTRRHGYREPDTSQLQGIVRRLRDSGFYDIWGAWHEDELIAWTTVAKIDDWAIIDIARSCDLALKRNANNAVCYEILHRSLAEERRRYVTYGLSSIQVEANTHSLHEYKLRMGFEAVPVCRVFEFHPMFKTVLASPAMSWAWEGLAAMFSSSSQLRKVAGMSRILSGRERAPLAWVGRWDGLGSRREGGSPEGSPLENTEH